MPDPPDVGLLTRYVLENPWPLTVLLAFVAGVMIFTGLRDGVLSRVHRGAIPMVAAVVVLAVGMAVTTSGERARGVVRAFASDVETGQAVSRTMQSVAPDATLHISSERNAGLGFQAIADGVARAARYGIESNRVTNLDVYSVSSTHAVVHMTCFTQGALGGAFSKWVLHVEDRGGMWLITRIVFVEINGQTPSGFR